jgi:hypothetical protein
MGVPWIAMVDSEGFMARVVVRDNTYDLEWRTYKGAWERATVTQEDVESVDTTIGAILALHMDRNERVSDIGPHHFVVWSRCRDIAIGYRFYDDGKHWWYVSDGWIPEERGRTHVEMDYLNTTNSLADALSIAIGHVLRYARQKDCGENEDE